MAVYYMPAYQLKAGCREVEGEPMGQGMISVPRLHCRYRLGREVFSSTGAALAIAREQRDERIVSLRRSLAKLEKLTY